MKNKTGVDLPKDENLIIRFLRGDISAYYVKSGHGVKKIKKTYRDATHARLWDGLTIEQQEAWAAICRATEMISGHLTAKAYDPSRVSGRSDWIEPRSIVDLQKNYNKWMEYMTIRKLKKDMIFDMIVYGLPVRQAGMKYRMSSHHARLSLTSALKLFAEISGWTTHYIQ